jgi:hypothetical protein
MAPDFVERLVSEEVEEGSFLKWTVRASGEPEPTVCWLRDGQLILEVEGASMKKVYLSNINYIFIIFMN